MKLVFDNNVEVSKSTGFDKAAKYSFWLSIPIPFVIYLTFVAAFYLFSRFIDTDPVQASRNSGFSLNVFLICVSACDIMSFVLGVVSLFGNRTQPNSFPLALVGLFAGGIIGFISCWIAICRVFGL